MNVSEWMSTDVRLCAPDDTIGEAARIMKEIDAGLLPVGENDRLVGMITDRDMAVRAIAEDKDSDTPVGNVMSQEVCYCFEDEDLDDVATKMSELQVRRLPVLSRQKRLVGIISLADISHAGDDGADRSGAALSGVTEPSTQHSQQ